MGKKIKIKCIVSFSGKLSMTRDETREVEKKEYAELLKIGYVEQISREPEPVKESGGDSEK